MDPDAAVPSKPDLGNDNPYPPLQGGSDGWASRYWDCCKPSCGWKGNASQPVASCDIHDTSLGVTDATNSCDVGGTSGAFTCHGMAPAAHSNQLAYGYAAFNGAKCGTCFQLQFTGGSFNAGNDPGSQKLAGKSMVVRVSNIGGIQQGQFDLLIPGGGVGDFNACSGQWGVQESQLGARYGGLLSDCRASHQGHEAVKQCMRGKCKSVFADRDLTELGAGCLWFVDWFEAADNPALRYQQVDCPSELEG